MYGGMEWGGLVRGRVWRSFCRLGSEGRSRSMLSFAGVSGF